MLNLKNKQSTKTMRFLKMLLLLLVPSPIVVPAIVYSQGHPCKRAAVSLRGDLDVVMNRGGMWALMEQTEGLQDKSMIGIQADGKLARLVGKFETMCEGEKKPTKQLFDAITNLLGNARTIWNPGASGEKIVKSINELNKKAGSMLKTIK